MNRTMIESETSDRTLHSRYLSNKSFIENTAMRFGSFEECNNALYDIEELDIIEYIDMVSSIPYDSDLLNSAFHKINDQTWINSVIKFIISVSQYDPREFKISLYSLQLIGIQTHQTRNGVLDKVCNLVGRVDTSFNKEKRYLKTNKLIESIDYIIMSTEIDGKLVDTHHNISRPIMYQLITKYFGTDFLEAIISRVGQIIYFFDHYKTNYTQNYIVSLRRTVYGLNADITHLTMQMSANKSKISTDDSIPQIINCDDSSIQYDNSLSLPDSTVVLNKSDNSYHEEISSIHFMIETSINNVNNRISDINLTLTKITSKIDDLVDSVHFDNSLTTTGESSPEVRWSACSYCASPTKCTKLEHTF